MHKVYNFLPLTYTFLQLFNYSKLKLIILLFRKSLDYNSKCIKAY